MKKRKCKKCQIEQSVSEFRDRPNNRTNTCKECERKYQRDWYKRNPELGRKRANEYQKRIRRDPEKRESFLEKQRAHYHKKGKYTEKKYIEVIKAEQPWRWRARNLSRNITKEITEKWLIDKYNQQNGRCALSGRKLEVMTFHIDHVVPKTLGGNDDLGNLRLVAPEANMAKSGLTDKQLIELCQDIIKTKSQNL